MKSFVRLIGAAAALCFASMTWGEEAKTPWLAKMCGAPDEIAKLQIDPIVEVGPGVVRRDLLPRYQRLPSERSVDLLMVTDDPKPLEGTNYKVILLDASKKGPFAVLDLLHANALQAAIADRKINDFSPKDDLRSKILLSFKTPDLAGAWYRPVDVYVVTCKSKGEKDGKPVAPELSAYGHERSVIISQGLSRALAGAFLLIVYLGAAYSVSVMRHHKIGRLWSTAHSIPIGFIRHLDPVVLSAGDDGKGSASKLQMLFFSMIVLWLVFYIWLMTEHLSELSDTVLLLMGIAGVGATAAAGADLTKNRLALDNWAWLVNKKWLPQGGIASVTKAQWRDIFTTNGSFDVPRFQLVTFSVVVGIGLLATGADLADLSTYSIPSQLLSILGLSQIVYVAGKLVAPPSIADLDAQLVKVRETEGLMNAAQAAVDSANKSGIAARQKALNDASGGVAKAEKERATAQAAIDAIKPNAPTAAQQKNLDDASAAAAAAKGVQDTAQAALDSAIQSGAATVEQQKALSDASAAFERAKNVARTAFLAIYQIPPNTYY